jgi:hypothetical protein
MPNLSPRSENWFYVKEGRRQGPFDRAALLRELLALDAPESVLVWRSGLNAWTKASLLEDLRGELPPPLTGAVPEAEASASLLPDLPGAAEAEGRGPAGEAGGPVSDRDLEPGPERAGARRHRRRRHRHRSRSLPGYLVPLVLLFIAVMLGLWFLLRRMNEVPPGRVIQQGSVYRLAPGRDPRVTSRGSSFPSRFTTSTTTSPGFLSPRA